MGMSHSNHATKQLLSTFVWQHLIPVLLGNFVGVVLLAVVYWIGTRKDVTEIFDKSAVPDAHHHVPHPHLPHYILSPHWSRHASPTPQSDAGDLIDLSVQTA